ncbi:MAG: ATPase [Candidatus Desulfofervidaceae bacterium]|nr:ATPase [Candidatus Desulfofervidaceae bacterium]MDL1970824.1 ATPase [Candidatus Desulfofervidaceae bacterium]
MRRERKNRLIQEKIHDPYYEDKKYPEGVICSACGAIYKDGRWIWPTEEEKKKGLSGEKILCPACRRVRDNYPAGIVVLSGTYLAEHKEEILNLANNIIEEEKKRSPLKRLINIEEEDGKLIFNFTDDHLARRVGEAVGRAHKGKLEIKYSEGAKFASVSWHRDS